MSVGSGGKVLTAETGSSRIKTWPRVTYPPQIIHGLARYWPVPLQWKVAH